MSYGLDFLLRNNLNESLNNIAYQNVNIPYNQNVNIPIINVPSIIDTRRVSPFITTDINNPFRIVSGYYPDLDKDPKIHKTLKKYYYYKLLDKWLYGDLKSLLAYVVVDNGTAKLIKSVSDYNSNLSSDNKTEDLKVQFLEKLISKDLIKSVLKRVVEKYNIHWYHLNKHEDIIKKRLELAIKELLEGIIKK